MNQFSDKYYLQIQQSNCGKSTGFTLPRLASMDDSLELTDSDIIKAEYHADMNGKSGIFDQGYYDINLMEFYSYNAIDSEIHIL